MRLKEVHITGFGKLVNQAFRFSESFHIVKGLNEAGKTTLVNAILGILYGFKGRSEEVKALRESYRPWDETAPYRASMVVNFGDAFDYKIERDFKGDQVQVTKLQDGRELPADVSVEDLLRERLGLPSGKLFQSTLLIKQEEVAELNRTELTDAIIKKITESGSGISVKEILAILADRLKELNRGFGRQTPNPGPIKACLEEIKRLREELDEVTAYHAEYNGILDRLKRKQAEKEGLERRIAEIAPLLEDYENRCGFRERYEQLTTRLTNLQEIRRKIAEKEQELNELNNRLILFQAGDLAFNPENLQKLEYLDRKINQVEQRIEQVNYEYQKVKGKRQVVQREMGDYSKTMAVYYSVRYNEKNLAEARRLQAAISNLQQEISEKEQRLDELAAYRGSRFSWTFWLGLGLCLFSAVWVFTGSIWGYVVASIMVASGILIIYFGGLDVKHGVSKELAKITATELERAKSGLTTYKRMLEGILDREELEEFETKVKEQIQIKQKIQLLEEELRSLDPEPYEEQLDDLQRELNQYLRQLKEILQQAGVESAEQFRRDYEKYKDLKAEIKLASDTLTFLREETHAENIDKEIAVLEEEIDGLRQQLGTEIITEAEYLRLKEELAELTGLLERAREEEIKIAAGLENYSRLILLDRDIWSIKSALTEKEALLKQLELEGKSIELAVKLIQEATEEARSKLAPQVKDKVIKIFQWITKKRYRDVRLEMEGDKLVFQYLDEQYNCYRDVQYLSTGTRDQLYLALRIALGEYLTNCATFPIFLDDPFVNFDSERLLKTIEILRVLAKEHQIIWLTKDEYLLDGIPEAAVTSI
ncbi:AAA family ATPase [Thermincola ferriacetica]